VQNQLDQIADWKNDGHAIVFTNGCFDLLHPGHIQYLEDAAKLGDKLIVGLNDDDSVRRLKGSSRPINNLNFRKKILMGLRSVNLVIPFYEDTPLNLIELIKPDFLVKGGDYTIETVVGHKVVQDYGGQVKILSFLDGYSSSEIISKIKSLDI